MSAIQCGEKDVAGCDHIYKCIKENFTFCYRLNEDVVKTGPVPRKEAPAARKPIKVFPETGCVECRFFTADPLDCTNHEAKGFTKLMTWPFKNICKKGEPK